jgi:hypothetical protein
VALAKARGHRVKAARRQPTRRQLWITLLVMPDFVVGLFLLARPGACVEELRQDRALDARHLNAPGVVVGHRLVGGRGILRMRVLRTTDFDASFTAPAPGTEVHGSVPRHGCARRGDLGFGANRSGTALGKTNTARACLPGACTSHGSRSVKVFLRRASLASRNLSTRSARSARMAIAFSLRGLLG